MVPSLANLIEDQAVREVAFLICLSEGVPNEQAYASALEILSSRASTAFDIESIVSDVPEQIPTANAAAKDGSQNDLVGHDVGKITAKIKGTI